MIRALLIIDVPFYRDGLAALLNQSSDVTVVATPHGGAPMPPLVARESADVILLDISAAGARETLEALLAVGDPPNVVVLAITETPECIAEWAALGALGYVSRYASLADLLHCLRCVARGQAYCSPCVMAMLLRGYAASGERTDQRAARRAQMGDLTARELEILDLVGCGLSNKLIAARLHISHATAKNHVHHILDKLRLRSRAEIAAHLHAQATTATNGIPFAVKGEGSDPLTHARIRRSL
jgi:DNA-binding NarL/FixJ family response regulator